MASIYDNVKTPKELLELVKVHELSTEIEDICRAQDIFWRAPIEDLIALANDNGRKNDAGEPDPKGSWSSGRDGLQKTFYSVLFHIWNWEDATRFWNQHTNPEYASLKKTAGRVKELDAELSVTKSECTSTKIEAEIFRTDLEKAEAENTNLAARVKAQEEEIMKLKAKLYDLMVEKEGE